MRRLPGLDLLRATAVVWVVLFHSFLVGGLGADFDWFLRFGWAGVDIFFVLSGFLIGTQVMRPLQRGERVSMALSTCAGRGASCRRSPWCWRCTRRFLGCARRRVCSLGGSSPVLR
jgi:hypothetical protein